MVLFMNSDWLLRLGVESAIYLLAMGIVLDFVCKFFLISQKKEPSGVGYPLVWCIVKQLFTELSMKSGRNFAHGFQTNHLSFGE